jgi:hypothetical protein
VDIFYKQKTDEVCCLIDKKIKGEGGQRAMVDRQLVRHAATPLAAARISRNDGHMTSTP